MGSGEYGHIYVSVAGNGDAGAAHAYLGHAGRTAVLVVSVIRSHFHEKRSCQFDRGVPHYNYSLNTN